MKWLNSKRILLVVGLVAASLIGGNNAKADLVMDAAPADDIPGSGKGESFSHDGLRLYLAANSDILPDGYGSRDICVVKRESLDEFWGEPVNLGPNINTDDHEGWPVISADELELYFGRGPDNGTQRWIRHAPRRMTRGAPPLSTQMPFPATSLPTDWNNTPTGQAAMVMEE
jgi:hypothetical protein